jgi:SPOR domain
MTTRSPFYRLALEANEGQANVRDDVLPVPTLQERVSLYLRAVHGDREFTDQERSNARDVLLNSMAAQIAAEGIPAEQMEFAARETTPGAGRESFLAQYSWQGASAEGQKSAIEPQVTGPLPPYYEAARRKEAISAAAIGRRRTSILALTVTFGLVLIVGSGTLGYRWTYPHMEDDVTAPAEQTRVPPPTTSPRSLSTRPAPKAAPEEYLVQIASQRTEADVLAVFRRLQEEQPTLFGQANLKRIDLGLKSYTAQVGPFASEKDAAALCLALKAADIQCLGQ